MRFKSDKIEGFRIYAVSGVNTISFAIDFDRRRTRDLLGFAVERIDPVENERYYMQGFKVFKSCVPYPTPNISVSTFEQPVQSFLWDDFTAKPNRNYEYIFHPLKGTPKYLDRSASPILINVETESLFSKRDHDIFFNRGVASSQAFSRRFPEIRNTDDLESNQEAKSWLGRDLEKAILTFIRNSKKKDTLLCCFYEFRYQPVADELKRAINRGVNVRLIVDGKENGGSDKPNFPFDENKLIIKKAGLSKNVIFRKARCNDIQHNKFMVKLENGIRPVEVWTGSTNISLGGIFGQTNVGHWVKEKSVAEKFKSYWDLLAKDPGAEMGDNRSSARTKNDSFKKEVELLEKIPEDLGKLGDGIVTVFSPRNGLTILDLYATMVDSAEDLSCITLAFGINNKFKEKLNDNTPDDAVVFLLLEKKDEPKSRSKQPFIAINAKNNCYKAWGSFIKEPLYQWIRETNTGNLKLNTHVRFIHSKFLLMDPLSADPIVVTGSANFSKSSTNDNDENMIIIKGNRRVADIYFTEFNRLFNHYYFRSITESTLGKYKRNDKENSLFLYDNDKWLQNAKSGVNWTPIPICTGQ